MNLNAFSFMEDGAKWRRIKRALNCIMNFSNFFLWFVRNCGAACSGPSSLGSWQCDWASPGDLHRNGSRGLGRLEVPSEWWVSAQESSCWGLSRFLSEPPGCPGRLLLIKNHSEIGTDLYTQGRRLISSFCLWPGGVGHRQCAQKEPRWLWQSATFTQSRQGTSQCCRAPRHSGNSSHPQPLWSLALLGADYESGDKPWKSQVKTIISYTALLTSSLGSLGCHPYG